MAYKDRSYSEQTIQRVLYKYFKDMDYKMSNVYMFGKWESDFFFLTKVKHLWEIEIKVDRQDYDREFTLKPKKHDLLSKAYDKQDPGKILLPNNFYFCAPEGVIPVESVPEYAGLIEIYGDDKDKVRYKKKAKKIHKSVSEVEGTLLKKFYNKTVRMEKMLSDFRIALFEDPENQEEIVRKFLKRIRM
jgi:hypothetical protein